MLTSTVPRINCDTRLIALALLLWGFGEGLFLVIQPLYFEQLGADPIQIGVLLSIAAVVRAASFLPAGIMADRVPRKWVMVGGWITGLVGVLLVAVARSWQDLVSGLLIYALSAYCIPVINVYLAHAVGGRDLGRTFTTVFAAFAVGGVVSPPVGGWLAEVTTMRGVYSASALLFAASVLAVVQVSPQRVPMSAGRRIAWRSLFNRRFLRFAVVVWLVFAAMQLGYPLAPNFLQDVGGWSVARIGMLGSFQALDTLLLSPFLGRLGHGAAGYHRVPENGECPSGGKYGGNAALEPGRGLLVGQAFVWVSALILLVGGPFVVLAVALLLRGAYQGCRSLTQAQASVLGSETERGLFLGATETTIAIAQVVAPYAAGWLYASEPAYPFIASLVLIPITLLVSLVALRV